MMRAMLLRLLLLGLFASAPARAEDIEAFYRGKTVTIIVGSSASGGYDHFARLISRHLGRLIPGAPQFIVNYVPGARGLLATNTLYNLSRRDGTVMAVIIRDQLTAPLLFPDGVRYDELKLGWIGSVGTEVGVAVAWHTAPHKTVADVRASELIVGGSGNSATMPRIFNYTMGTRFKVITGYQGSTNVILAMEKGELQGIGEIGLTNLLERNASWLSQGKVSVLFQTGYARVPQLPDVPLAFQLALDEEKRRVLELTLTPNEFARPLAMPPDVPRDRLLAFRKAFTAMVSDAAFLADARVSGLVVAPRSGEDIEQAILRLRALPKAIIEAARAAAAQ